MRYADVMLHSGGAGIIIFLPDVRKNILLPVALSFFRRGGTTLVLFFSSGEVRVVVCRVGKYDRSDSAPPFHGVRKYTTEGD